MKERYYYAAFLTKTFSSCAGLYPSICKLSINSSVGTPKSSSFIGVPIYSSGKIYRLILLVPSIPSLITYISLFSCVPPKASLKVLALFVSVFSVLIFFTPFKQIFIYLNKISYISKLYLFFEIII